MDGREGRGPAAGPALIGISALAATAAIARASMPLLNGPDPFWHWDLGRQIVATGLPRTDPYSFLTGGQDWILNQWGADALFGLTDRIGGLPLLVFLTAVLVGGGIALIGWQMWRRSPSLSAVGVLALVVAASLSNWALRGNLLTFLLLPLLLHELARTSRRPVRLIALLVVWANVHATFVLGAALIVLDSVGRWVVADTSQRPGLARQGTLLSISAVLAGAVTPYGPRFLLSIGELLTRSGAVRILEWAPPTLTQPRILPFTLLLALVLIAVSLSARRDDLPDVLIIVATALFGLTAVRNVAPAAIVVGILGAPYVHRAWHALRRQDPGKPQVVSRADRGVGTALVVTALVAVGVIVPKDDTVAAHADRMPLEAIAALNAVDREVRVVTSTFWAPAVGALTGDHVRTAVDGRIELFTDEQFGQIQTVLGASHGWENILDDWCVTDVLVSTSRALHEVLSDHERWDDRGVSAIVGSPDSTASWLTLRAPLGRSC